MCEGRQEHMSGSAVTCVGMAGTRVGKGRNMCRGGQEHVSYRGLERVSGRAGTCPGGQEHVREGRDMCWGGQEHEVK